MTDGSHLLVQKKKKNLLFIFSPIGHAVDFFFFSRKVKMIFNWNCDLWWFIKWKSMATAIWESKTYTGNTKWIPMVLDDILRSYEVKWAACARNWALFTALLPVIQSADKQWHDSFPQTASFGQFVSMNWFNTLVCLCNHAMTYMQLLLKHPMNDVK